MWRTKYYVAEEVEFSQGMTRKEYSPIAAGVGCTITALYHDQVPDVAEQQSTEPITSVKDEEEKRPWELCSRYLRYRCNSWQHAE